MVTEAMSQSTLMLAGEGKAMLALRPHGSPTMLTAVSGLRSLPPPLYLVYEASLPLCAEFLYTPLLNTAEGNPLERTLLTVDNLWHYGIKGVFINIGIYIGISCGGRAFVHVPLSGVHLVCWLLTLTLTLIRL